MMNHGLNKLRISSKTKTSTTEDFLKSCRLSESKVVMNDRAVVASGNLAGEGKPGCPVLEAQFLGLSLSPKERQDATSTWAHHLRRGPFVMFSFFIQNALKTLPLLKVIKVFVYFM